MPNKAAMEDFVADLLLRELPSEYCYHDLAHTLQVTSLVNVLGKVACCSAHELNLLDTAALWHDTGFIKNYKGHEDDSIRLAREYLPGFGYQAGDIDQVCRLIEATRIPHRVHNGLGAIMADADLGYLGTGEAAAGAALLYRELQSIDPSITEAKWLEQQISFLEAHHYFTPYFAQTREGVKAAYLASLRQWSPLY